VAAEVVVGIVEAPASSVTRIAQVLRFAQDDRETDGGHWEKARTMSESRAFLRHTVATVAYRGAKAVRGTGPDFAGYSFDGRSRTPAKILAHVGDLIDWAFAMSEGRRDWQDSTPLPWDQECERFFGALKKFDDYLASEKPLHVSAEKLFQAPIADALTHIGQIAMLRRMAGVPMKSEFYFLSEITVGRVGADQTPARKEFD
jgi:hypothetical protein